MKKRLLTLLFSALMAFGVVGCVTACDMSGGANSSSIEETKTTAVVHFDVNTTLQTNVIKDKTVTIGKRVSKPNALILEDNPTNLQVYGWYTTPDFTEQWDFKKGKVQGDMTLYAKWVELYDINYYVNGQFLKTENVFNGDLLAEDATVVEGFKYLGTYTDATYTEKVDFTSPITGNTDVYVQRSEGLYLSDHTEEEELSSGTLTDNVAAYLGTITEDGLCEEGWVEEYTVTTKYETGEVEENCTYVNFGCTTYGDPYIELCRSFDITQSQIIRVWYKNLGRAEGMCMYFTTLMDPDNNVYSETGMNYTQNFCYPNYIGNDDAKLLFTEDQKEMDESAEWECMEFNLYEIYKNGYSIWGTSPYLGALRLQANYKSTDGEDFSNIFLIKAIEGVPYDVEVKDSDAVERMLDEAKGLSAEEVQAAAGAQVTNENGFVFPKDYASVQKVSDNAQVVESTDGILFYSDNEIVGRETGETSSSFTLNIRDGQAVDLGEYTTLHVTLQNFGYATSLLVSAYNDEGVPVKAEIDIAARMLEAKTYTINLYGIFGMSGTLKSVEVQYSSVGVDNLLLIKEISFGAFMPYDTVGINFDDKNAYGFTSTNEVEVSFVGDRNGTRFNVLQSGASLTTPDKTYKATTDGYAYATLKYIPLSESNITKVIVEYKVNDAFSTPYEYVLALDNVGKANTVTLPFVMAERGYVQGLRLTFIGTGAIILQGIEYSVGETGLPFYQSYSSVYDGAFAEWFSGGQYLYDDLLKASSLVKNKDATLLSFSLYIGYTTNHGGITVPHTTFSPEVTATTKLKIVYQNRTDVAEMLVNMTFSNNNKGSGEESDQVAFLERHKLPIDANMGEYEWSTLVLEVSDENINLIGSFLSKVNLGFTGKELTIRAISIEN